MMRVLEQGYRDLALPRRRRRRLAEAALLLDPTHEEACRVVMRCAAEDGEIGAALHAYDALYRLLGDEYDMEPSAPTLDLVAEIKQGKFDGFASREASAPSLRDEVAQILIEQRPSPAPAPTARPAAAQTRARHRAVRHPRRGAGPRAPGRGLPSGTDRLPRALSRMVRDRHPVARGGHACRRAGLDALSRHDHDLSGGVGHQRGHGACRTRQAAS